MKDARVKHERNETRLNKIKRNDSDMESQRPINICDVHVGHTIFYIRLDKAFIKSFFCVKLFINIFVNSVVHVIHSSSSSYPSFF